MLHMSSRRKLRPGPCWPQKLAGSKGFVVVIIILLRDGNNNNKKGLTNFREEFNSFVPEEESIRGVGGRGCWDGGGHLVIPGVRDLIFQELHVSKKSPELMIDRGVLDNQHHMTNGEQEHS